MFSPKPKILHIDGIAVPIDPDFRIMCEYSEALSEKDGEKACGLAAAESMTDFYILGLAPKAKEKRSSVSESCEPCFDFSEDEAYFYADFLNAYGIDLNVAKLHWFDFCALFRGLPDECKLKQIIGIRTERLSEIKSSAERSRVIRLKRIFALKKKQVQRFKNTAERDRAMLDEVERIHREAMERMRGEGK